MSIYKPKSRPYYLYDFQLGGHRFHGSTRCTSKREAEAFEKERRKEAAEQIADARSLGRQPMTFGVAATRYWNEVGQHVKSRANLLPVLSWLQIEIGNHRPLKAVDGRLVAALVAKRRACKTRTGTVLKPATVNRVTDVLRTIVFRAERVWGEPVTAVDWRRYRLKQPQERVRELREDEEARMFAVLREDYHPIVRFALLTGCRLAECVNLRWADVDWGGRQIWIRGKGDKLATIPLSPTVRELLCTLREHDSEVVFTYQVRNGGREVRKGARRPITYEGLKTAFGRAVKPILPDYRFHDNRHTAATRILRASGNLRVAQALLRHSNISTTTKYAHVMQDDVVAAMEAAVRGAGGAKSPDRSPTPAVH